MRNIFIIVVLVLSTTFSYAQEKAKKTPEDKAKKKTTEMVSSLKLTKEQENMLYSTNLKAYQSIEKYDTKEHSKKDKKKQKDMVQKLRDAEYKKIMSPAQYKEYLRLEKEEDKKKDAEKELKKQEKKKEKEAVKEKKPETKDSKAKSANKSK